MISVFFFVLLLSNQFCLSQESSAKGLLVVPGLGRPDRLGTVVSNLRLLEKKFFHGERDQWDCIVYIYAVKSDAFWTLTDQLTYLQSMCELVENPNGKVTENLHLLNPSNIKMKYDKVFIALDDCKLSDVPEFDLSALLNTMKQNNLSVISPMIVGANVGGGQKFRNIMQTAPLPGTAGYVSSFVEIFVWVMTMPAYQALWELLSPRVNPYAWGYDFWYDGYARDRVVGHKMGIMSTVYVTHEQNVSLVGAGRTDNTPVKIKWAAVLAQENYYKKHLEVDLKWYRNHLNIDNSSWNGAVKGYLTLPKTESEEVDEVKKIGHFKQLQDLSKAERKTFKRRNSKFGQSWV